MKRSSNIVLLLLIWFIDISSSVNNTKSVKSREDALAWLNKYGYNPCLDSKVQCSLSFSSLLEDYQKSFRLKITGILDERTQEHMNRPRCGNRDKPIALSRSVAKLSTYKWSRSSLTYSVHGYPKQFTLSTTKNIIREAFDAWLEYIPLTIKEVCTTCGSDFVIDFASEQHSDSYPFDGAGGTLAHAFFPEDGRVHFDEDEAWTERFDDDRINLYLVAVHEIGHALGLDHTFNADSIMYPSYQPTTKSRILPQPDRDAIQRLYGKKQSSAVTPAPTRSTSTTTTSRSTRRTDTTTKSSVSVPDGKSHPRCRVFLDAAFDHPDGTLHTFNAGVLWRYLPDEGIWEARGSTFKQTYSGLPNKLSAGAYNSRKKEAIFFSNARAYRYDIDDQYRAKLRRDQILPRNLQNSIVGALYYHSTIYIITKKTIRSFQLDNGYQQSDERDLEEEFPRFTGIVEKAFSYGDLHLFFTTDRLVSVWNERLNTWEVLRKPMDSNWFACSGAGSQSSGYVQTENRRGSHRYHNYD